MKERRKYEGGGEKKGRGKAWEELEIDSELGSAVGGVGVGGSNGGSWITMAGVQ